MKKRTRKFTPPMPAAEMQPRVERVVHDDEIPPRETWTVNGTPIAGTPFEHAIAFAHTDQGIELANKRPNRREASGVKLGREPFDRMADPANDSELEGVPNPLLENAAPYKRPGFRQRWLGTKRIEAAGMRGWQPVLDSKGEQVKCGRMILAEMPEAKARRRNQQALEEDRQARQESMEQFQTAQARLARDTGAVLRPGEIVRGDEVRASIGVSSRRGNLVEAVAG